MKLLSKNWATLSRKTASNSEELLFQRRNILFSRFALFGFFVVLVHTIHDGLQGLTIGTLMDICIGSILLLAYGLNEAGRHTTGKIVLLTSLNLILAIYCSISSKHNGIYLFFFPLLGMSSTIFERRNRPLGLFFIGLSAAMIIGLVMTDFKLLGNISIPSSEEKGSFLINLISSSVILVVCINFMMKYNDESERRLMNLAEEIRQKNIHLEKTNSELDQFVYSASHDLRAPLLSVQGIVNIARHENTDTRTDSYLTMINNQVIKLDNFIRDIIRYSHNARTEISLQAVSMDKVIDEVHDNLKFMQGMEKIRLEKEADSGVELITDKSRVSVIINNLVSNAIKYHNFSKDDRWIKVGVRKNCTSCTIIVKDNGIGIAKEHQPRIFDMFYRAHEHSNGSGLGLYIVKEIVSKMNGTIQLQSSPGQGSTFTIMLPLLGV
jgi:signal transduction histidine kinase